MLTSLFKAKRKIRVDVKVDLKDIDPELDRMLRGEEKQSGPWSVQEDVLLMEAVSRKGSNGWSWVASHVPARGGKQVRERWTNYLDPALCQDTLLPAEREILVHFVHTHGRKWSDAARVVTQWRKDTGLAGRRTDNLLKNTFTAMKPEEKRGSKPLPIKLVVSQIVKQKKTKKAKQAASQPKQRFKFVLGQRVNFASVNAKMRESAETERLYERVSDHVPVSASSLFAAEEL